MFKAPFSFNGRIRRREYLLSLVFFYAALFLMAMISTALGVDDDNPVSGLFFIIFFLAGMWFLLAQAVKRSHDLGNSGWFILIPLYGLWLLFANSAYGENEYGLNPKGEGNAAETFFSFEQEGER